MSVSDLTLPESLRLLALMDDTGEKRGSYLEYALAGAALTELVLAGRLTESGKKLDVASQAPLGDPYLDGILAAVAEKGSGKNAKDYVQHLGGKSALAKPLYERLVERGILGEQTAKILWVFDHKTWPQANPQPERQLIARLRTAITGSGLVDTRDSALIALADKIGVLHHNFDKDDLKRHKDRLKRIKERGLLPPNAAIETIKGLEAAVMIAAIMPAIIVSTTS